MARFILASGSPRRREILAQAGYVFEVIPSAYEEDMGIAMPPRRLAEHLSHEKARDIARQYPQAVVLAADTFIVHRHRHGHGHGSKEEKEVILGKPSSAQDALRMLSLLSGQAHEVITGYTVMQDDRWESGSCVTVVRFKNLSPEDIQAYVDTGEPLDKAGAYAIQGIGRLLVAAVQGDELNVIGLPLQDVAAVLARFGVMQAEGSLNPEG